MWLKAPISIWRVRLMKRMAFAVANGEVGNLLELVRGFTRVIIIDALKSPADSAREPGEIVRYEASDFKGGQRYGSAHSIGLGTVLELGDRLGYEMPRDVVVYAIEAVDVETFGEQLSAPVAAAAERVIALIRADLEADAA